MKLGSKKILFVALAIVLFLSIFVATRYALDMREGKRRLSAMVEVADKFQPPVSWILEDNSIKQPSWNCVTGGCPGVHKNWKVDPVVTIENFADIMKLVDAMGWEFEDISGCDRENSIKSSLDCYMEGTADGATITFVLRWSVEKRSYTRATLRIE